MDFVQQALMHEESKQGPKNESVKNESALMGNRKKNFQESRTCFKCGTVGHIRRNCPQEKARYTKPVHKSRHGAKVGKTQNSDSESESDACVFTVSEGNAKLFDCHWLIDSGASSHMTKEKSVLVSYQQFGEPESVALGDGRVVQALGYGNVHMDMLFSGSKSKRGVIAAVAKGNVVKFRGDKCWISDSGSLANKLYKLDCEDVSNGHATLASQESSDLWHQRLGHVHEQRLNSCIKNNIVKGICCENVDKLSFWKHVHSDVCGPMQTESFGGARYFVTFTDDYSRCCAVYFMKQKLEVLEKFKEFEDAATNEAGRSI
ncbi:Retrovirus-related Pol poly from transposon TNT 1-94 [Paramuricea clavata]|uniref:Retrovirus-related Pol poly from transposon TNT 1-94 n=1 Tax=Paramuricea clavata TaxID=317549 RepID=A0A7D9DAD5_PARCT|nr:Retrovirus-related Pol poly from transposon TNT 1-94 [Paramuricea clavata]